MHLYSKSIGGELIGMLIENGSTVTVCSKNSWRGGGGVCGGLIGDVIAVFCVCLYVCVRPLM